MIAGLGSYPGEGNGNPLQYSCLEKSMDRGRKKDVCGLRSACGTSSFNGSPRHSTQEQTGAAGMWPMAQERGWLLLSLTWDRKSKAGGQWVGTSDSFSLPPALPPVFRQREEELFVRQGVPRVATREPSKLSSQGRLPGGGVTRGPVSWRMVRKLRCSGEGGKQVTMCAENLLPV